MAEQIDYIRQIFQVAGVLSRTDSPDAFCRLAVELGRSELHFDRLGFWFFDKSRTNLLGSFGVDAAGHLIDERGQCFKLENFPTLYQAAQSQNALVRMDQYPIRTPLSRKILGYATAVASPLWNGEEIIGVTSMDNFITQKPITQEECQLLALYSQSVGQLYSLKQTEANLRKQTAMLEASNRIGHVLSQELDIHKLMQAVTDAATDMTGAAFGAFFYNVEQPEGEVYALYTLSGVARSRFADYPMPRRTAIFEPTFAGKGIVRYDDVTTQPHFGQNTPYHGMPHGHIPVRSYLAASVVTRGGKVLGGLFLGHPMPGVFQVESEAALETLAAQAAIALENAELVAAQKHELTERRQREQELEILLGLTHLLRTLTVRAQMLPMLVDYLITALSITGAAVSTLDAHNQAHQVEAGAGALGAQPDLPVTYPSSLAQSLLARQIFILTPAEPRDAIPWPHLHHSSDALAAIPLIMRNEVTGVLWLTSTVPFRQNQIQLLVGIGDIVATAFQRALLYEQTVEHNSTLESRVATRTAALAEAYEQLQELDRLKSKFVSDISHELRSPITNITFYIELLKKGRAERRQHYMEIIQTETSRLKQLVEDTLDLSQLELHRERRYLQEVDLRAIVRQVVNAHEPLLQRAGLAMILNVEAVPPVWGDANQLAQVVTDLLGNATKYTPSGQIEIRTWTEGNEIGFSITDTGQGIEDEDMPHIFERFYRGKKVGESAIYGTGLGLSIVKEIIELHRGRIAIESQIGSGTTVRLWLPFATGPAIDYSARSAAASITA